MECDLVSGIMLPPYTDCIVQVQTDRVVIPVVTSSMFDSSQGDQEPMLAWRDNDTFSVSLLGLGRRSKRITMRRLNCELHVQEHTPGLEQSRVLGVSDDPCTTIVRTSAKAGLVRPKTVSKITPVPLLDGGGVNLLEALTDTRCLGPRVEVILPLDPDDIADGVIRFGGSHDERSE